MKIGSFTLRLLPIFVLILLLSQVTALGTTALASEEVLRTSSHVSLTPWSQQPSVPLVDYHGGSWLLDGTTCASAASCYTFGSYLDTSNQSKSVGRPFVSHFDGSSWTNETVPALDESDTSQNNIGGISCPSSSCYAIAETQGGVLGARSYVVSRELDGWSIVPTPLIQSDAWLTGISCASPEFCMATGAAGQTRTAAALMFNGTTWIPLIVKHAPMWSGLFGVSCPTTNWCVGVGWWSDGVDQRLFTATWNGRQWKAWPSTGSSSRKGSWGEVSCPSRASCVAVGTSGNGNQRATIGILGSNDWTVGSLAKHGTTSGLGSVSCSSSKKCAAAGYSYGATGTHPMIVRRTAHGWVDAIDANSYASNRAFSAACPTTNWCTAGITQDTHHKPIVLAGSP